MDDYLTATLSTEAVRHNLALLREAVGPHVKLCPVVKADAYGHGLEGLLDTIIPFADCLAVMTPATAMRLRFLEFEGPILLLWSACAFDDLTRRLANAELIASDVTQTISDPQEMDLIGQIASDLGVRAKVHLKMDTGMGRAGVPTASVPELVARITRNRSLALTGIYTHFATADAPDSPCVSEQLDRFNAALSASELPDGVIRHAANSAATLTRPDAHFDMVRPGLAVYGYQPCEATEGRVALRPVLRITGRVLQVKALAANSRCGYGLTYRFERDSRVARVPIGYGDGYPRCLSNRSVVRIHGMEAPIRGRVSMDQLIVDVTDIPAVQAGDVVEIVSDDPTAPNSVENLARLAETIPYEITCRLRSERITREFL